MLLRSFFIGLVGALALVSCGPKEEIVADSAPPRVEVPTRGIFPELDRAAVRLSPDGQQLAYLAPFEGVVSIWLAPADDLAAARAVALDRRRPVESLWWAYSGEHILFRHAPADGETSRLLALSVESGESKALTAAGREADLVHLSPSSPGTVVVAVTRETDEGRDLFTIDIASGEQELLAENEPFAVWGVDDDLDLRLALEPTEDGGLRVRKKAETGEWADFSWVPAQDASHSRFLGFDASMQQAYFLDSRGRRTAALVASNMTSGEARLLFQDQTADVVEVLIHPVAKTVQAVAAARARRQWRILDEAVRPDLDTLQGLAAGDLEIVDRSLDDAIWLAAIVPFDAPRRFYRYDRSRREAELLFVGRPGAGLSAAAAADAADAAEVASAQ